MNKLADIKAATLLFQASAVCVLYVTVHCWEAG